MAVAKTSGNLPPPPPGSPHEHMRKLDREGTAYTVSVKSLSTGNWLVVDVAVIHHSEVCLQTQSARGNYSETAWFPMGTIAIFIHEH